jgi:radical SAM protein with 4Fe4S-binding SPASM domain
MNEIIKLQNIYLQHLKNGTVPLPRIIHVETRSKCNGKCSFCPASAITDDRDDSYMPVEIIKKIIDELSVLDYSNRLSFYNNNEPFLDERIFQFVEMAREKIPKAYLELKTNGIGLTIEKIIKIFNVGLDMLYINYYSDDNQFNKNIQEVRRGLEKMRRFKGHLEGGQYFTRIKYYPRYINSVAGTRAGNSPNKKYIGKPLQRICLRPLEMMTINPEGNVSVCSEDFYFSINMGNIKIQNLLKIWMSHEWNDLRNKLIMCDRSCTNACSKCDYKGYTYEMVKEHGLYKKNFWFRVKDTIKNIWLD